MCQFARSTSDGPIIVELSSEEETHSDLPVVPSRSVSGLKGHRKLSLAMKSKSDELVAASRDLSQKKKSLKELKSHRRKAFDPEWLQMFPWLQFTNG